MPKLTAKSGDIEVSAERVAHMADRMFRLQGQGRRDNFLAKAKARLDEGHGRKDDAATVLARGGGTA
ncbi:MAG TPA: hypothetical protein VLV50_14235 [Stellaceae bacterium]|nr:hypothetical protein [Stellaceae bacterium]